jgi:hypothetical protein
MNDRVFVFLGAFANRDAASAYCEPQWEPEPDQSVSYEEYSSWEDRNPTWQMRSDLGVTFLDSDFIGTDVIETIDGTKRFDYLGKIITEHDAVGRIRAMADDNHNVVVLIFPEALGGFPAAMKSTPLLKYCGEFSYKL